MGIYILDFNLILTKMYCIGANTKIIKKIKATFKVKNKKISQNHFLSK